MRRRIIGFLAVSLMGLSVSFAQADQAQTLRLYDGIVAYLHHADGGDLTLSLDVRDMNHMARGPSELLLKVYGPDGSLLVREVIEDDGVVANTFTGPIAGYDHEAWYYATLAARGLDPAARWSVWTKPERVAAMPRRTFTYPLADAAPGRYRVVLVGSPDHIVTLATEPAVPVGIGGSPDFLHGYDDVYERRYVYVPRGTLGLNLAILQMDRPAGRHLTVRDAEGNLVAATHSGNGYGTSRLTFDDPEAYAGKVLTVEVSDGPGAYLFSVFLNQPRGSRYGRPGGRVFAALCPDPDTARILQNGAIYHDGEVYWQAYQVQLHDWLKTLDDADFEMPADLAGSNRGFISVGSHENPAQGTADRIMHDYGAHRNRQALNVAIREMHQGMSRIGPEDHVMRGLNLAYEMGSYSFFYPRPAWRILQQSDAPDEVKDAIRAFVIQTGDRLAFARGIEMVNGNALASLMQNLRYCVEAVPDPVLADLFERVWKRFTTGGFHDRIGVGPSGGVQESFGYDYHYGGYVVRGWRAVIADLGDERFNAVRNGIIELYSYTWTPENLIGGAWSSRTSQNLGGGSYSPQGPYPWKGFSGPDFTVSVKDANEFFAARRPSYYAFTYHGRITPSWMGEGFHGQIGFGGGMLNLLQVPDHGPVIASRLGGSYGGGGHLSNWRDFTIHSVVGTSVDGRPLVSADSEHLNARLEGNTVTSSADIRRNSMHATRTYTFNPAYIECSVRLGPASHERILGLWGGVPRHRGAVSEAYEMIPLLGFQPNRVRTADRPDHQLPLVALNANGEKIGEIGEREAITAHAVALDRGGYGVVVQLEEPRPMLRGKQGTLLIELAKGRTDAAAVGITYRLVPFVGTREAAGEVLEPERYPLQRIPEGTPLAALSTALADAPAHRVLHEGRPIAELRMGLAGDRLALEASVLDPAPRQGGRLWDGSCVEVFGSMFGAGIGQVFLLPQTEVAGAKAFRADGSRQTPATGIALETEAREGGYTMRALIPVDLLAIDPAAEELLLEFQVTVAGPLRRGTLFESPRAYENSHRYGRFVVPE